MIRFSSLAAMLIAAASLPATVTAEDASVLVDVLVLDRDGKPVAGLNRSDFEIAVGDQIRPVTGIQTVAAGADVRRFVFVVNRRGGTAAQLRRVKKDLEEFVSRHLGDRDEALFVDFAEVPRITRGWRRGPAELLREVRNITPMGFRSPLGPAEDTADAAFMLGALAQRLTRFPGRKVVILFSASLIAGSPSQNLPANPLSYALSLAPPHLPESKGGAVTAPGPLVHAFNAAGVTINAIHLEGVRRQENGILVASRADSSVSPYARRSDAFPRRTDDFLSSLASETGGSYASQATDFARILESIENENRLWYELRFAPFGEGAPGRYQPHEVRVRNHRGLKVVVRAGHVVPN